MSLLSRLRKAAFIFPEAEEAANLIESLEKEAQCGKLACQAMHDLRQAALTRGYDSISSAIAAALTRSVGSSTVVNTGRDSWT